MTTFIALYRGRTIGDARMIAVSAKEDLVSYIASKILSDSDSSAQNDADPVVSALEKGRKQALELISNDYEDQS